MNDALSLEKFRAVGLEKRVFGAIAANYAEKGNVLHFEDGITPGALRELADAIAKSCGGTAAVFSGKDGCYSVCLAHPGGDVKALGAALAAQLDGRGGGKPGFFQGSVNATRGQIEAFFQNADF